MIPWRTIFLRFAEERNWGPEQVLPLTMPQVRMYLGSDTGNTRKMSKGQASVLKEKSQARDKQLVEKLKSMIRSGG